MAVRYTARGSSTAKRLCKMRLLGLWCMAVSPCLGLGIWRPLERARFAVNAAPDYPTRRWHQSISTEEPQNTLSFK